jgi:ATP-dependent DNA helicase RecG
MSRPPLLFPLFAPLETLPGVGPRLAPLVARVAQGPRVLDLLFTLPTGMVDRHPRPLAAAREGEVATAEVTVEAIRRPATPRQPWRVVVRDGPAIMDILFFGGREDWIAKQLPVGEQRLVSGRVEAFQG